MKDLDGNQRIAIDIVVVTAIGNGHKQFAEILAFAKPHLVKRLPPRDDWGRYIDASLQRLRRAKRIKLSSGNARHWEVVS